MKNKREASQYRERLDKTLASPDLTNEETIEAIVKNQLQHSSQLDGCSESVLKKRTMEVSNFLDMLRSASLNENEAPKAHDSSHPEWKIKQDNEELRVMYREGDQGTPFHTLLAEGYVDGPVDECLCVSWESSLYKKWWPQIMIPSFRILSSKCVQKVRVGEEISLLRVKVPWPLSTREALVHYFEFEYVQDDLVIVLVNTISDVESIDIDTHGFSKDGIPEAKDVVRIDVVGGFVIQKVTPERSYFRTIARMDIKLDFVPPSLINFMARQLIGNGFKLYEKIVASAFKNDDDFCKALSGPLYVRIRKALFSSDEPNEVLEQDELNSETFSLPEEHSRGSMKRDSLEDVSHKEENPESESSEKCELPTPNKAFGEIEEEGSENGTPLETCTSEDQALTDAHAEKYYVNGDEKLLLSPKVEEALGTLDKVIFLIQKYGFNAESKTSSGVANVESKHSEVRKVYPNSEVCAEVSREEATENSLQEPRNGSSSRDLRSFGSNHNKIAPAVPKISVERKFEIEGDLEGKYKDWQKKLHPDLVHSKSEEEREYAAEQSARVIDEYRTLRSPLLRAKYILKLENVHVDEEETISEPELLAEIMEIREAVEEATTSQNLKQIQTQMQEKLNHWAHSFANAFQSRRFDEAITSIRRMTYYERVNEEIVKKL